MTQPALAPDHVPAPGIAHVSNTCSFPGEGDRLTTEFNVAHALGTANDVPEDLYHEVTEIHGEPGRTLTLMVCERGTRGNWGYLDVNTGRHVQVQPDPGYAARFNALNPHHR